MKTKTRTREITPELKKVSSGDRIEKGGARIQIGEARNGKVYEGTKEGNQKRQ